MGSLENFNFAKFPRLIETGTGEGLSVHFALNNGATEVHTVEECPAVFLTAWIHFRKNRAVHLNRGRSVDFLRKLDNFENAIIFLDAHFAGGADYSKTTFAQSVTHPDSFPLIEELEILLSKDISNAVIIIDDARIYYEDCPSKCPELLRQWDKLPQLESTLDKFTGHTRHLLGDEQGYVVLMPNGTELSEIYMPLKVEPQSQ